jgi:hypothetical protein|tara:strand:- start:301 stop:516 length:216 start_codon:yes stop_codon:yes gene_type:complete
MSWLRSPSLLFSVLSFLFQDEPGTFPASEVILRFGTKTNNYPPALVFSSLGITTSKNKAREGFAGLMYRSK